MKRKGCPRGQVKVNGKCISKKGLKPSTIEYYHYNNIPINWDELTIENREKVVDDVIKKHSYARVKSRGHKDILDATTAHAIKTVKDALKKENKEKFLSRDLYTVVDITWKLVK